MGRPKSTGCRTCRQRRVKCDEKRPFCNRCEKAGYDCEGYSREYRFLEDPGVTRALQRATKVHLNPSLSGFEDNIYISYLLATLSLRPLENGVKAAWLQVHAESIKSPVAQQSIVALSSLYFGRKHHHKDAMTRGTQSYGKALRDLNIELRHPKKCASVSALSSAFVLQIYEFIATDSEAGWLTHARGTGKLVQVRGPSACRTLTELQLFEANRVTIILDYWKRAERCYLEEPEWKTLPWSLHPGSKSTLSYLQDILCDIPGLIEDVKRLKTFQIAPAERESFAHGVVKNIYAHLAELYDWRAKWDKDHPNACVEVQAPKEEKGELPLFATHLHFSAPSNANQIIYYDGILLMLVGFGFGIVGPTFDGRMPNYPLPHTTPYGPLALPGAATNTRTVAIEMCRIAGDCLTSHLDSVGLWLLSPMKTAYLFFSPTSREAKWLDRKMVAVADISGFEIGKGQGVTSRSKASN